MSEVSVVGCGAMGRALITALAEADVPVTIWNHTATKAHAQAGPHVTVVGTYAAAVEASPLTILCVADHDVAVGLLEASAEQLGGRTVFVGPFATPGPATSAHEFVVAAGGRCRGLVIPGHPTAKDRVADGALTRLGGWVTGPVPKIAFELAARPTASSASTRAPLRNIMT